jgi:hypothetical protein
MWFFGIAMNPDARTLICSYGNEYGPNAISGRRKLQIDSQQNKSTVILEHRQADQQHIWTAVLAADTEQAIWDALKKSDFPDTPRPPSVVADSTICDIDVENQSLFAEPVSVSLPLSMLEALPGYEELLPILQSIIFQVSGGHTGKNTLPETVVSQIQPLEATANSE